MSYHNTSSSSSSGSKKSTTNTSNTSTTGTTGRVAPYGYHYMPDGTLMSDAEHAILYDTPPPILDTPEIAQTPASAVSNNCSSTTYIPSQGGTQWTSWGLNLNYWSIQANGISSIPINQISWDITTPWSPGMTWNGQYVCQTPTGTVMMKFLNLYIGTAGNPNVPVLNMSSIYYTSSWDDILVELISEGYASPGNSIPDVEANPNFQAANGSFSTSGAPCLCPPCCNMQTFKNVVGQILGPVYQAHPNPAIGASSSNFQQSMWTHYQNSGCSWWANRVAVWTAQLPSITNAWQLALKNAKIQFAQQMHTECCCPGPIPAFAPPISSKQTENKITVPKKIRNFDLGTKNILAAGEVRTFTVEGDAGAVFSLEIKSGANYYNFCTKAFQTTSTRLENAVIKRNSYNVDVTFPAVSGGAEYDFYLFAGSSSN